MAIAFDFDFLRSACPCGRTHQMDVRQIWLESGALRHLPEVMAANGWHAPVVVCDDNTWAAAEAAVRPVVGGAAADGRVQLNPDNLHANEHGVALLEQQLEGRAADVLLAVGSGTVHDLTRYVAFHHGLPFLSFPTAASVDGFVSTVAAMTWHGCKKTMPAVAPLYVFADPDVFSKAPQRLSASGLGDVVGKYIALTDWRIAHLLTGEYICQRVIDLMDRAVQTAADAADDAEQLMYALLLSGLAMQMVGNSRPASGAEHHMSHFWEMEIWNPAIDALHGEKVGVGTILASREYHALAEQLRSGALHGIPSNGILDRELAVGIPKPDIRAELEQENDPDPLAGMHGDQILAHRDEICALLEQIPTPEALTALLDSVGGPTTLADIHLSTDMLEPTLRYSCYVRNRLTMMRLRKLLA